MKNLCKCKAVADLKGFLEYFRPVGMYVAGLLVCYSEQCPPFPVDDVAQPLSMLCLFGAERGGVVGARHGARFFATGAKVVREWVSTKLAPLWHQLGFFVLARFCVISAAVAQLPIKTTNCTGKRPQTVWGVGSQCARYKQQ